MQVLARLERAHGQEERTCDTHLLQERIGGRGVGGRQVVGPAGHHCEPIRRHAPGDADRPRPAGTARPGRPPTAGPAAGPPRASAPLASSSPPGSRRHATSCTVTTSRSPLEGRTCGDATETEWTTSYPAGSARETVVPGPGQQPAREARRVQWPAERGQRVGAAGPVVGWPAVPRRPRRPLRRSGPGRRAGRGRRPRCRRERDVAAARPPSARTVTRAQPRPAAASRYSVSSPSPQRSHE